MLIRRVSKIMVILTILNYVSASKSKCIGKKYNIRPKEDNLKIMKRNISNLDYINFARQPTGGLLENTGETIRITSTYKSKYRPYIQKGPLGDEKYKFEFCYFHWLDKEWAKEAGLLPFELHTVFSNTRFGNYEEAARRNFGIVILVMKHAPTEPKYSNGYYEHLMDVQNPNDAYELEEEEAFALFTILELGNVFSVYIGKSTVPNTVSCNADVIWIDYDMVVLIMSHEVKYFKDLMAVGDRPMMNITIPTTAPTSPIYHSV
ncbi:uncharacterized protein LOC109613357 [Musca domestica]|uniref:Uncharacterized protein LOC109613357 n=1 Tax=Musca domestica TaxID=7370 RepID=A0A9J7DH27_MUSDO|nr:uncharacterized protein LOC109613357 [Musca domestica]